MADFSRLVADDLAKGWRLSQSSFARGSYGKGFVKGTGRPGAGRLAALSSGQPTLNMWPLWSRRLGPLGLRSAYGLAAQADAVQFTQLLGGQP